MTEERRGETFVIKGEAEPGQAPIEFTAFLLGLVSAALIHLGEQPDPETGKTSRDLVLARESLELLALLREKTRGNLTVDEERMFATVLADLQIRFVEVEQALSGEAPATPLPFLLRAGAMACLFLSAWVGLFAARDAVELFNLPEAQELTRRALATVDRPMREVLEPGYTELYQALEGMRGSRAFLLGALSACCGMSLVGSARLLRPAGLPREAIRRLLAGAALGAGVLRTLEGAQFAAVARRAATVAVASLKVGGLFPDLAAVEGFQGAGPVLLVTAVILQTILVAGSFVVFSQYLQSETVRRLLGEAAPR